MTKWIKCSERLPTKEEVGKDFGWFLVVHKDCPRSDMSRYDGYEEDRSYEHGWKYSIDYNITHWMPLPEMPKEEEDFIPLPMTEKQIEATLACLLIQ